MKYEKINNHYHCLKCGSLLEQIKKILLSNEKEMKYYLYVFFCEECKVIFRFNEIFDEGLVELDVKLNNEKK